MPRIPLETAFGKNQLVCASQESLAAVIDRVEKTHENALWEDMTQLGVERADGREYQTDVTVAYDLEAREMALHLGIDEVGEPGLQSRHEM